MKEMTSMSYSSSASIWKLCRWMNLDLIFTKRDKQISFNLNPPTKFSTSSGSTTFNNILPWNISQMITNTTLISKRIVKSYLMKRGIPLWVWREVNGNWGNIMIRISWWRECCRTNTRVRKNKPRTNRVTVKNLSKSVKHQNKVKHESKLTRSTSSSRTK